MRALVRETSVSPGDLVFPMFISEAIDHPRPISTMPGISQITVREVAAEAVSKFAAGL